jgi:gamma-glutamyltranspeptidase/glutathione hydrolase
MINPAKMAEITAKSIYPAEKALMYPFATRRSVVHSTNGMVASTQPLATQAGVEILRAGGNCAVS